jgi:radical SAM superfamily enzyme YgiQ (UPF0313 family)
MRIHFIFPRWQKLLEAHPELKDEIVGYEIGSFRMASLGIPTAVAALPPDVEVTFQDENMEEVDYDVRPDLVALGFFTPQAKSAYRIAEAFRERGVPTLAGGIHPTMAPEDTLQHFDSIVVGEVEGVWPRLLDDLARGKLQRRYDRNELSDTLTQGQPRRTVFDGSKYLRTGVVQISRGCRYGCAYCVIPRTYGQSIRYRPIAEVVEDIRTLPFTSYYIADENLVFANPTDRAYATELLDAIAAAGIRKVFYVAAYPWMMKDMDLEFMHRLRRAGCRQIYAVLGLDQPLRRELTDPLVATKIEELRAARIEVMGSFMLGHDGDDASSKDLIIDYCEKNKLNMVEFALTTPFPGTPQFAAMKRAGRILHEDWSRYNCANVVFKPRNFTEDELAAMYLDLWRGFYRDVGPLEMKRRYVKAFSRGILDSDAW